MISETAPSYVNNSLPKSSDFNKHVWRNSDPDELLREGYANAVEFAPKQAQHSSEVKTMSQERNEDKHNATDISPTAIDYHLSLQLRIPDEVPETRNWVTMHALQEWEGFVVSKNKKEKTFVARLRDLTAETGNFDPKGLAEEEATIPLVELSDVDIKRIRPGSVFRWVIGYERNAIGTKRRISQIVFRDLPSLTEQDKSEGIEWARTVMRALKE